MRIERGSSIMHMLGGFEPSRAVNESNGDDPVSMGMLPGSAPPPLPLPPPPPTPSPEPAPEQPSLPPENLILLDSGVALFNGRQVILSADEKRYIIAVLINALQSTMIQELMVLRQAYDLLEDDQQGQTVQSHDGRHEMVRPLQEEAPQMDDAVQGEDSATALLQVSPREVEERKLSLVPSRNKRSKTPPPQA